MYPITNEVKALFESEQRKVLRITGTDKNGATISITDDNVIEDSFQIDRYSCNGEKLEVGTAIAAQMSFTLENGSGQYDGIVFEDAELFAEVGIADWTQSSPTITYVPCGYFTPDNQPRRLSTISITALDRMTLFDVVVDAADLTFPTTIAGLVGQVCTVCGVTLAQSISGLVNASVAVMELPTVQGEITYRNLIQWCAGIMGTNAWFDWNGQLRFSWYENATGYVSTVDNRYSSDLYEDDLTVSGIEYTNNSGIVIVEGTDDYVIDLTGNAIAGPLIATVLPPLNTALNGFTYRPFTAATVNAPYLWPMDVVTFTDKDGNNHTSVLTNVAFGLNGTTAMESKGMTYAINKLAQPKGFTREQAQLVNQAMEHVEHDIDESLTQQDIFNRLTDDGAAQGLVLYNGQLYINASYINTGYLSADRIAANSIAVGKLTGTISGGLNNTWVLDLTNGTFTIGNMSADKITTGMLIADRINLNSYTPGIQIPDEYDASTLLDGQSISDGWIVKSSGDNPVFYIANAVPWRGKTLNYTYTSYSVPDGGSYKVVTESGVYSRGWIAPSYGVIDAQGVLRGYVKVGNYFIYTGSIVIPNDAVSFTMAASSDKLRAITVDSDISNALNMRYGSNISLSAKGLQVGKFVVDKTGNATFNGDVSAARIEMKPASGASNGGFIDFHYGGSSADYTSRLIENASGNLHVTGSMSFGSPIATCAALAPGIPTAAYTLIPNSNYGPNVSGDIEPLRCFKYGNGLKRLIGLISITGTGAQAGGTICTVPTGYEHINSNNGGLQGWGSITKSSGGESYLFRFSGSTVSFWGAPTVPTGTYALNYLYF